MAITYSIIIVCSLYYRFIAGHLLLKHDDILPVINAGI